MNDLIIVGDEAYTREEWQEKERRRAQDRAYRQRPDVRPRIIERVRRWQEANPERKRANNIRHMRRRRAEQLATAVAEGRAYRVVASLHDLRCSGPTKDSGCRCRKMTVLHKLASVSDQ